MNNSSGNDLAQVITNFLPRLNAKTKLPAYKLRTLDALQKCRTSYMGGHVQACEDCGEVRIAFNSCRNRSCPQCGGIDKEKWVMAREADLIPVRYFHVVFTVPDKLNDLFLVNQETMYNLLFTTAWSVLNNFGNDKKWIGGKIGATAILHTWGQNLRFHPHVHFIVPAGALIPGDIWKHSRSRGKYLFKVELLSQTFRARLVENIRCLIAQKKIKGNLPNGLFDTDWVVFAKKPFGGPKQIIKYLSRYTHRTAISNDRILNVYNKKVTFTWKDYSNNYNQVTSTLDGDEFLRLFTLHILPPGFTRIRHYGYLSSAAKTKSLAIIRAYLKVAPPATIPKAGRLQEALQRMGIKSCSCKACGGTMVVIETLQNKFRDKQRAPPDNTWPSETKFN